MNKYKKIFLTISITAGAFAINYGINFFLTPFITDNVGTDAYGYVSLAKTIASYANIVTVALNGYASRFIAVEYHNKCYKQANIYYSSVLLADLVLALIMFLMLSVFSLNINIFFVVPTSILTDVKGLFVLIFLNLALNISSTALQAASYIANKLDVTSAFRALSYIAEAGVLLLCYTWFTPHITYVAVGILAGSLVICGCNAWLTVHCTPELTAKISFFSFPAVKKLVSEGMWNSVSSIGSLLNSGLDLVVTNLWLSPLAMGQISIVKSITTIFTTVYQQMSTPFQPILLREYAINDKESLLKDLLQEMKIVGLVSGIVLMGFASLGQLYFQLWIPNQDTQLFYRIALIAVLSGIIEGVANPLYYVYTLTVKNKLPSIITILGGCSNVLGMYVLIHYTEMGIYAVQITTAGVAVFIGLIFNPLYSAHCLQLPLKTFYPTLFRHIGICFIMGAVLESLVSFFHPYNWIGLICSASIEVAVGTTLYILLMFSKNEKLRLWYAIRKHLKK